jgi:hypothetical protein
VSVALYVALNVATHRREGRVFPPVVNIMVAAHIVWFTMVQFPILMAVVPFLHCLQYLMVTAFFDFKEAMVRTGRKDLSPAKYFGSRLFARYYTTQVAIGFGIFMIGPAVLSSLGAGSKALAGAVVISVVNLHHFVLDGAIWKLRKPAVGRPLLT